MGRFSMLRLLVLAGMLWFLLACEALPGGLDHAQPQAEPMDSQAVLGALAELNEQNPSGRYLARRAEVDLKVAQFDEAKKSLDQLVAKVGGHVHHITREREKAGVFRGTVVLRVPSTRFSESMDELLRLGEVFSQQENTEDLTDQVENLALRLKNARALEERILHLLTQREARLSELLEAERELARLRERIEQLEARQERLMQRTAFSTITVNLFTQGSKAALINTWWAPLYYQALRVGQTFATSLGWLLAVVVFLIPWLLLLWFSPSFVRRLRRRWRDLREEPASSEASEDAPKNTRRHGMENANDASASGNEEKD